MQGVEHGKGRDRWRRVCISVGVLLTASIALRVWVEHYQRRFAETWQMQHQAAMNEMATIEEEVGAFGQGRFAESHMTLEEFGGELLRRHPQLVSVSPGEARQKSRRMGSAGTGYKAGRDSWGSRWTSHSVIIDPTDDPNGLAYRHTAPGVDYIVAINADDSQAGYRTHISPPSTPVLTSIIMAFAALAGLAGLIWLGILIVCVTRPDRSPLRTRILAITTVAGICFLAAAHRRPADLVEEGVFFVVSLVYVVVTAIEFIWARSKPRPRPPLCKECGYNLTGNVSGVCPECGVEIGCEQRQLLARMAVVSTSTAGSMTAAERAEYEP